jgi:hypothetical protein
MSRPKEYRRDLTNSVHRKHIVGVPMIPKGLTEAVLEDVNDYAQGAEQSDDITILAFRVKRTDK